MERQAWKLIVLLLLFCYVHSPYVKAQVGNGKQITMEFKNEGLPSIFKRLQKLSGYKVLFIYDEVRSYHSTGKVEKASIEEVLKVIIGKHPLKYIIEGQFINITHKNPQNVISEVKGKIIAEEDGTTCNWCNHTGRRNFYSHHYRCEREFQTCQCASKQSDKDILCRHAISIVISETPDVGGTENRYQSIG